ncbi:DUF4064 domain-containing protein [Halobacillus shinanisalinarum]|uniref:DUF4064 domain-containing protein n=1 Tax=Halobacillus shinanisalinarum TaxID=2932258 RepID=A0ABY4GZ88_9BACI|nr:DUF4064 domain-containing protein [Halobacillus shinanisalinarum]UOQ92092.1 DUF4064 domain-containing protein [Halobacillus shinanisalinarum]
MKRNGEFILGLIGGIIGLFSACFALLIGAFDLSINEVRTSVISGLGWAAFLFSISGIVGSVLVKSKTKVGTIIMISAALGGLVSIAWFYVIPAVLLLIAGIMGIVRKEKAVAKAS